MNTLTENRATDIRRRPFQKKSTSKGFLLASGLCFLLAVGILIAFFIAILPGQSLARQTSEWLDTPVTIQFQNKPLKEVLNQIGKQTGISILYDQTLANEPVIGNFNNIKASDAVNRLFKGKNKIIQVDDVKKVIVVKTFGAKNFIWAGPSQTSKPMTLSALDSMLLSQYQSYKSRISNFDEILASGITRGQLRELHSTQYQEYLNRSSSPSQVVTDDGLTRGQLLIIQKKQYSDYLESLQNDDILFDGHFTRNNLSSLRNSQLSGYQERISRQDIPVENGMLVSEIRTKLKNQLESYNKRQKDRSRIIN